MAGGNGVLLQAAIRYAELGYPVFPCAPGTKTPLTEHGFHDATVDPEQRALVVATPPCQYRHTDGRLGGDRH